MDDLEPIDLPEGFIRHDGGAMPVSPDEYVEVLIDTVDGIGSGGVRKAKYDIWEHDQHENGHGRVLWYRKAKRGEEPIFHISHRFTIQE